MAKTATSAPRPEDRGHSHARSDAHVDPHSFRNSKQDDHSAVHARRRQTSGKPATSAPRTIIGAKGTADGPTKSSAKPAVNSPTITVRISEGPANGIAAKGK